MPRIGFGASDDLKVKFDAEVGALTRALRRDVENGLTKRASLAFAWEDHGIVTTLSIAGDAQKIVIALEQLSDIVDPLLPASDWIEPLSELLKSLSAPTYSNVSWSGVDRGVLEIARHGTVEIEASIPKSVGDGLQLNGPVDDAEKRSGE